MIFPSVTCDCDPEGNFVCGEEEHVLRLISSNKWPHGPMTEEQRQWCIREADSAGEGSWSEAELLKLNDQDLAHAVLQAWRDYIQSNCL
jgi:hypothetical protein